MRTASTLSKALYVCRPLNIARPKFCHRTEASALSSQIEGMHQHIAEQSSNAERKGVRTAIETKT